MRRKHIIPLGLALAGLVVVYLPTLQTVPNGGDHYYMADVGEMQIVLNLAGTLHATGYPLYVITGNVLVNAARALGVPPAAAPSVASLVWGIAALSLVYILAFHLTGRSMWSAAVTAVFGLTQTVWLHSVIAETYAMGLAILALLLLLALWRREIPHRVWWLALVGGIGVAHHRLLITVVPALLYAVWPHLTTNLRRLPRLLIVALLLGLVGFVPYVYLPLRAQAGAAWVYDQPDTWEGFWDQFTGREAENYVRWPESASELSVNLKEINAVLVTDLTVPGVLLGIAGLLVGLRRPRYRRAAVTLLISAITAYAFHVVLWHTYPLPALTLPSTLSLAFAWLFLGDELLSKESWSRYVRGALVPLTLLCCLMLVWRNLPFVKSLTEDPTGFQTIALAQNAPPGSTLMMEWGPRYFAVGFAHDVLGELGHIEVVDHQADFSAIVEESPLVTPEYTFYNRPVGGWEEQLGTRVYLRAVGPYLVQIDTRIEKGETSPTPGQEIQVREQGLRCTSDAILLEVAWFAPSKPERDLSVFVHLLDGQGEIMAQADQFAPVYGWRPTTTWEAGEIVRDVYPLPRLLEAQTVRYGLYRQLASGEFQNEGEFTLRVECGD